MSLGLRLSLSLLLVSLSLGCIDGGGELEPSRKPISHIEESQEALRERANEGWDGSRRLGG